MNNNSLAYSKYHILTPTFLIIKEEVIPLIDIPSSLLNSLLSYHQN